MLRHLFRWWGWADETSGGKYLKASPAHGQKGQVKADPAIWQSGENTCNLDGRRTRGPGRSEWLGLGITKTAADPYCLLPIPLPKTAGAFQVPEISALRNRSGRFNGCIVAVAGSGRNYIMRENSTESAFH